MFDLRQVQDNPSEVLNDMSWGDLFSLCCLVVYSCAIAEIRSSLHMNPRDKVCLDITTLSNSNFTQ